MARPLRIEYARALHHVTSRGMRQLNGVYTQYVNHAHQRAGHVSQGRYKAVLVQKEAHLLELSRCVVLNPVRAGMVADAALWPWSFYAAVVGTETAPPWLETDWLLSQFGADRPIATRAGRFALDSRVRLFFDVGIAGYH